MINKAKLLIIVLFLPILIFPQIRNEIDSLLTVFQTSKNDSAVNKASSALAMLYVNFELDSAEFFAKILIERGEKQKYQQWKGNLEQIDDICIIGFKI